MANLNLFHFTIFISILSTLAQSQDPDLNNKCGNCPCNQPCNPPPSLPPPSPPPPSPPPPPKQKPPPSIYCPPPPSGSGGGGGGSGGGNQNPPNPPYIYINGPPGNLYPVDAYYSGSGRIMSMGFVPFLIVGALGVMTFW